MKLVSTGVTVLMLAAVAATAFAADRKHIVLRRPAASNAPFSEAVLKGDTLYLSGHIGLDPATGKPGTTAQDEARLVMESFKRTLAAGGMTMDDLVTVTVYSSDVADFDAFNGVYRTYFHDNFPARAFIGSGKLLFGARFEVQGIAVKRGQ